MLKFFLLCVFVCTGAEAIAQKLYREVQIPTRVSEAGKKFLNADVYSNDQTTPKPVILIQTPYNRLIYRLTIGNASSGKGGAGVPFDTAKYNYVTVDWRGFYGNREASVPQYNRGLDGYDIVEWIATQPWCNGKVGTWGGSALGHIQFLTAAQQPPHLVCAAPFIKAFTSGYEDYYYGGVYRREHVQSLESLGFITEQMVLSQPTENSIWKTLEKQSDISDKITVPMFMCSGWFDHYPTDVLRDFGTLQQNSDAKVRNKHKLLFGPWGHSDIGVKEQGILEFPEAEGIPITLGMQFFDFYLRGEQNGWENLDAVRYFVMGDNEWKGSTSWNPTALSKARLFLQPESTLRLSAGASNSTEELQSLPKTPVPTIGGSRFNPSDRTILTGPQDIQSLRSRADVKSFSTPTLTQDVTLLGSSRVLLYLDCNRRDADVSVRICDVYPDGKWVLLTQGIHRLRFRKSTAEELLFTSGTVDTLSVFLNDLGVTFKRGHKIGLVVSGTNYPMFDINPQSGDKMYTAGDTLNATIALHFGGNQASVFEFNTPTVLSSVEEESAANAVELYPNPATNLLSLHVNNATTAATIQVLDLLGNQIHTTVSALTPTDYSINISTLPQGVYMLRYTTLHTTTTELFSVIR